MKKPYKCAQFHQCWPVADALLTLSQKDDTFNTDKTQAETSSFCLPGATDWFFQSVNQQLLLNEPRKVQHSSSGVFRDPGC